MNCTSQYTLHTGAGAGTTVICQLGDGHPGSHLKTFLFRDTVTWRDKPPLKHNECGATHYFGSERVDCERVFNHSEPLHYGHDKQGNYRSWRPVGGGFSVGGYEPPKPKPKGGWERTQFILDEEIKDAKELQDIICAKIEGYTKTMPTPVPLTLEDLKAISYAISGKEWAEDEPELVYKIDKALKAAL